MLSFYEDFQNLGIACVHRLPQICSIGQAKPNNSGQAIDDFLKLFFCVYFKII